MTPNQSHVAWLLASILEHQAIAERYGWNGLWETLESCMEMLAKAAPTEPQSDAVPAEAVEVVAYRVSHPLAQWKVYEQRQDWAYREYEHIRYEVQDLMTVAQHERILADIEANRDALLLVMRVEAAIKPAQTGSAKGDE